MRRKSFAVSIVVLTAVACISKAEAQCRRGGGHGSRQGAPPSQPTLFAESRVGRIATNPELDVQASAMQRWYAQQLFAQHQVAYQRMRMLQIATALQEQETKQTHRQAAADRRRSQQRARRERVRADLIAKQESREANPNLVAAHNP